MSFSCCCCCRFIAIVLTCLCLLPVCKGFFEVAFCGGLAIQMKLLSSSILPRATLLQEEEDLISTFSAPQRSNSFYLLILFHCRTSHLPALNGSLLKLNQIPTIKSHLIWTKQQFLLVDTFPTLHQPPASFKLFPF